MSQDPEPLDAPFYSLWQRVITVVLAEFASIGMYGYALLCTFVACISQPLTIKNIGLEKFCSNPFSPIKNEKK